MPMVRSACAINSSQYRVLHPVEIAILRDLGFTVRDAPLVYAFLLLAFVRRRR